MEKKWGVIVLGIVVMFIILFFFLWNWSRETSKLQFIKVGELTIPVYPGSKEVGLAVKTNVSWSQNYLTPVKGTKIREWYINEMQSLGWEKDQDEIQPFSAQGRTFSIYSLSFIKGNVTVIINGVLETPGYTMEYLIYTPKPELFFIQDATCDSNTNLINITVATLKDLPPTNAVLKVGSTTITSNFPGANEGEKVKLTFKMPYQLNPGDLLDLGLDIEGSTSGRFCRVLKFGSFSIIKTKCFNQPDFIENKTMINMTILAYEDLPSTIALLEVYVPEERTYWQGPKPFQGLEKGKTANLVFEFSEMGQKNLELILKIDTLGADSSCQIS